MDFRGFVLVFLANLFLAISSILFKFGMDRIGKIEITVGTILGLGLKIMTSPLILLGLLVTGGAAFFYFELLSKYPLNFVYPLLSLVYILTAIGGIIFLGEKLNLMNWLGILSICFGVGLISWKA